MFPRRAMSLPSGVSSRYVASLVRPRPLAVTLVPSAIHRLDPNMERLRSSETLERAAGCGLLSRAQRFPDALP